MKKAALSLLAVFVLFVVGCKLDEPDFSNITPGPGTNNGTNTGSSSTDYAPLTKGTFWKYTKTANGATIGTETHTLPGTTQTINNKTYYLVDVDPFNAVNPANYYYHANGNYALRSVAAGFSLEYLYLKDNFPLGQTWTESITDNGSINGVPARIVGKIIEAGITKVVLGKTFTNVAHSQLDVQYNYGQGFTSSQKIDFYVAKNIGMIETDSDISGLKTETLITDYSIK